MKTLSIGQKVVTYCTGDLVEGIVDRNQNDGFIIKHRAINWGNEIYTETFVSKRNNNKYYTPKVFCRI